MWIPIILLLVVLYYIGKNDKGKKNKGKPTQAQTKAQEKAQAKAAAAQRRRKQQYDAETKELYKTVISDYKKIINLNIHSKFGYGKGIRKIKKWAKEYLETVKEAQKTDSDGIYIRQFYSKVHRQFMQNAATIIEISSNKPSASSSFSTYSAPISSQPTYSSDDYYARKRKQEEQAAREQRQRHESEVFRMERQIDELRRYGSVIEADELEKKLNDFK